MDKSIKNILVTGGLGFIGSSLINKLLNTTDKKIFNIDKCSYSSNKTSIERNLKNDTEGKQKRYKFLNIDLYNFEETKRIILDVKPDIIFHLAAESHVDRSIKDPQNFVKSNVMGTYHLLEAARAHYISMDEMKKPFFKFIHISTDEVYGSLEEKGKFTEKSPYDPRSPYSATKASSDHLVSSWWHTFKLPVVISNCSNNYGPWQFPEKLIPTIINKALNHQEIPIYGDGSNIRDWLHVEDHIEALLEISKKGVVGEKYLIGGSSEKSNLEVAKTISKILDLKLKPKKSFSNLIKFVEDRPGHDFRYAIDYSKIENDLSWKPKISFNEGISKTIDWYMNNQDWIKFILEKSSYDGGRLGII